MYQVLLRRAYRLAGLFRWVFPWVVALGCVWLLVHRSPEVISDIVWKDLRDIPALNWLLATLFTAASFWALGRYDGLAHRQLGTGLNEKYARISGQIAIAFSQTVGFGVASGAFARWRMIPGLSAVMSVKLTLFVAVSFLTALGGIIATALIAKWSLALAVGFAFCLGLATACALFVVPTVTVFGRTLQLPTITTAVAVTFWTVVDVLAAGTALYLLMPSGTVAFEALLWAYVIALGVAIVSGAPGGVGPFELTLLGLLPTADAAALAVGVISFRIVYFALPALISGVFLLSVRKRAAIIEDGVEIQDLRPDLFPVAETAVARQTNGKMAIGGGSTVAFVESAQSCVALFDPIGTRTSAAFDLIHKLARMRNKIACFYKVSPRTAAMARENGWRVVKVAEEARLSPLAFSLSGSKRRQLRRKLRNADAADVQVSASLEPSDWDRLADLDRSWQVVNGRARGLTTGRFERDYVADQMVFVAKRDAVIEAFLTVHAGRHEWAIDIMRTGPLCPDGTMHKLIVAAIESAARANVARFSLAACPAHPLTRNAGAGLAQFKRAFSPTWRPVYLCAPSWPALMLAALDIVWCVHRPAPV